MFRFSIISSFVSTNNNLVFSYENFHERYFVGYNYLYTKNVIEITYLATLFILVFFTRITYYSRNL